jgi:phenylalanyl-tRNA synthetase beta chain
MKLSLDWLSDFVDVSGIAPAELADRLTMASAEVEGFETLERFVDGVVVGEVVALEPIPELGENAGARVATVDAGGATRTTVTTATNVRVGLKAPWAPAGCTIADGVVAEARIGGRPSEGVLCSARELGFGDAHEGVLELPRSLPNGTCIADHVPARDVLFEIDNKSLTNRPDLWGHYGFAREIAAVFGRELRELACDDLDRYAALPAYDVTIVDPSLCRCYTAIAFEVDALAPSPLRIQARLHALGQRTFGTMVDLSNYVMLETAQPTHAFDAAAARAVRVATAGAVTPFRTLDGVERELRPTDLMIWNEARPIGIAGVMGGAESECSATTSRVLLESANFAPASVRRTATRLGLRTDAAQRFEKNLPPALARQGAARILHLLSQNGIPFTPVSRYTVAGDLDEGYRELDLPVNAVERAAGFAIGGERIAEILRALRFRAEIADGVLRLGVPPFRSRQDVSIPADVVEEVMRIYGYDNVPAKLPSPRLAPVAIDNALRREHKAQRALAVAHRFNEVHTYVWFDDAWLARIGFEPGPTLDLLNPSAEGKRRLRTTLVPNLLALIDQNRPQRSRFRLFEAGRVFRPLGPQERDERTHIAGVSFIAGADGDVEAHYLEVKGAVEELAAAIGTGPLTFRRGGGGESEPWKTDGEWAAVYCDGEPAGALGILRGRPLEASAGAGQVIWFELDLSRLPAPTFAEPRYEPPPVYSLSWQDFTLLWGLERSYAELSALLDAFEHPLIRRRAFRGLYKGKDGSESSGSYTFRYDLGAPDRTLSRKDLEEFHAAFLAFLEQRGIRLKQ